MRDWIRPVFLLTLVLLVPIVPFLAMGGKMHTWAENWQEQKHAKPVTAVVVVGLLATDILLPVPSSVISTTAGWQLGLLGGTLASWLGMNLGAMLGFAMARRWGGRFARWFTKEKDLERMNSLSQRYGPVALILTRGVPILAEASVLLMGMHGLSWRRFLPPILLSNLGIALAYSTFGVLSEKYGWFSLALGVSIVLPVLLAITARWWMPK